MNGKIAEKKLIYICAPLKGDVTGNIARARGYCKTVIQMGCIPIAPHVMLDGVLNDEIPHERQTALEMGLSLVARCNELWIFTKVVSEGMQAEIDLARERHIPVKRVCFDFERHGAAQQPAESGTKGVVEVKRNAPHLQRLDKLGEDALKSPKLMDLVVNGATLMSVNKDVLRGIIRVLSTGAAAQVTDTQKENAMLKKALQDITESPGWITAQEIAENALFDIQQEIEETQP